MPEQIQIKGLTKHFPVGSNLPFTTRQYVHAVDDVNISIESGETLGLVGESGSGKSTLGRLILRLLKPTSGSVFFNGENVFEQRGQKMKALRRQLQIVFQDPDSSLDPRATVGRTLREAVKMSGQTATRERVKDLLEMVGLEAEHIGRYPHQLSGGQKQRVGIARALAVNPKFIVTDEPVSALDVSIQAQILNLLSKLQKKFNLTYLFITHDLSVVRHIADRVAVMYLGKIMEVAPNDELFNAPAHPYTQALLSAVPDPDPEIEIEKIILTGDIPSPINPPTGCRFHTRCPKVEPKCKTDVPELKEYPNNHWIACHLC